MKKTDVLVLNKNWVPIHIISWKKGVSLISQEKCRALDREFIAYGYSDWLGFSLKNQKKYPVAWTINYPVAIPEIIVSITFEKLPSREVKFSRQNIFSRDGHKCVYCGQKFKRDELTLDHIIPRSKGGHTTWDNTVSSCFSCNQKKADRTPNEAGMHLKIEPKKPKWIGPIHNYDSNVHPCKSWEHFMPRVN